MKIPQFIIGLLILIFVTCTLIEVFNNEVEIDPIMVGSDLTALGYSSTYLTSSLIENINDIIQTVGQDTTFFSLSFNKDKRLKNHQFPEFKLPQINMPMKAVARFIRKTIGKDRRVITGYALSRFDTLILEFHVIESNSGQTGTFNVAYPTSQKDSLFFSSALGIIKIIDPLTAISYLAMFNHEEAINNIKKQIYSGSIDDLPDYLNIWALILDLKGQRSTAIDKYKTIIQISDDDLTKAIALGNWGASLAGGGDYLSALEKFRTAIEIKEDLFPAYYSAGQCYMTLKDHKNAIELFEKSISEEPEFYPVYTDLATCKLNLADTIGAIAAYSAGDRLKPLSSEAYYRWGLLEENTGNKSSAISQYLKVELQDSTSNFVLKARERINKLLK